MNDLEMKRLLAKMHLHDKRQVTELVLAHWMETIGHLPYQDAYEAVVQHQRESTEYLQPAHITQAVRKRQPQAAITMSEATQDLCAPGTHKWVIDGTCAKCVRGRREET